MWRSIVGEGTPVASVTVFFLLLLQLHSFFILDTRKIHATYFSLADDLMKRSRDRMCLYSC